MKWTKFTNPLFNFRSMYVKMKSIRIILRILLNILAFYLLGYNFKKAFESQSETARKKLAKKQSQSSFKKSLDQEGTWFKVSKTSLLLYIKLMVTFHYNMMQLDLLHSVTSLTVYSSKMEMMVILLDLTLIFKFETKLYTLMKLAKSSPINEHS